MNYIFYVIKSIHINFTIQRGTFMNCQDCGYELNGQTKCPICGWSISGTAPQGSNIQPNYQINQSQPPVQNAYGGQYQQNIYGMPSQPQNFQAQPTYNYNQYQQNPYGMSGQYSNPYNTPASTPPNPQKKSKTWLIILLAIILVLLIGVLVAVVINNNTRDLTDDDDKKRTTEERDTEEKDTEEPDTEEPDPTTEAINYDSGTKTIMIYMVGSDLESFGGYATSDLEEILGSGFDDENTKVVIYTGGSLLWYHEDVNSLGSGRYVVENGELVELETGAYVNMGDPDTLSDFLTYGYENFPAEQYSVILWNHGGGQFYGYGVDEVNGDRLYMDELHEAFANSPFSENNKLEFIGFDACLMATIETANALYPYANYLISSQESEPGNGWNYNFLDEIDDMTDGKEMGAAICDYYVDGCKDDGLYDTYEITLSVMDLNKYEDVENAVEELFAVVNASLSAETFTTYSSARTNARIIAAAYTGEESLDIIDLTDYANQLSNVHPTEAAALTDALAEFIVYNCSNVSGENGVTIYHPFEAKENAPYFLEEYNTFDFSEEYTAYINDFNDLLNNPDVLNATWDIATMIPTMNGDYTFNLQLTEQQAAEYKTGYFVISRADVNDPDNLIFVAMEKDISFDSTGTVMTANFDGSIRYVQNDTTLDTYEVMYKEHETTESYSRYLLSCILYNDDIEGDDAVYAYFVVESTPDNPAGEFLGAYPIMNIEDIEQEDVTPERYVIDPNDYQNIAFGNCSHEFTSEENLTVFEESDWSDVVINYSSFPVSEGYSTVMGPMINDIPYFGMFIIEDMQGNRHVSNIVQIK